MGVVFGPVRRFEQEATAFRRALFDLFVSGAAAPGASLGFGLGPSPPGGPCRSTMRMGH